MNCEIRFYINMKCMAEEALAGLNLLRKLRAGEDAGISIKAATASREGSTARNRHHCVRKRLSSNDLRLMKTGSCAARMNKAWYSDRTIAAPKTAICVEVGRVPFP